MNQSKISVRYAKALFLLAREKDILEEVKDDMVLIQTICNSVPEFNLIVESPVIQTSDKQKIIFEIVKDRTEKVTQLFLDIIIKNKREIFINDIARRYIYLFRKEKGIKTIVLKTAVPVDMEIQNKLIEFVKKKLNTKIELQADVKKELIGGFQFTVDDLQYDASVSTELRKMKRELIKTNIK